MKIKKINGKDVSICEECLKPIPAYPEYSMAEGQGFVYPESRKFKPTQLMGIAAVEAVEEAVCKDCYRLAYKKVYPESVCPIV